MVLFLHETGFVRLKQTIGNPHAYPPNAIGLKA